MEGVGVPDTDNSFVLVSDGNNDDKSGIKDSSFSVAVELSEISATGSPSGREVNPRQPQQQQLSRKKQNLPSIPSLSMLRKQPLVSAKYVERTCFGSSMSSGCSGEVFSATHRRRLEEQNAVKQQYISEPEQIQDKAYRECRTLLQLNHLRLQNKCPNFVYLLEWFKITPPLLFGAPHVGPPDAQYLCMILDRATSHLYKQVLDLASFRSVLFQLLYALYVAQREYQFVHHDLHAKNILLKEMPNGVSHFVYHDCGNVWYVSGPVVNIADFGLSRIRLNSSPPEVIFNVRDPFSEAFLPAADIEKVLQEIQKCAPPSEPSIKEGIKDIKKLLRKGKSLQQMLRVSFFDVLRQRPTDLIVEACQFFSSNGDVTVARDAASGLVVPAAPVFDAAAYEQNVANEDLAWLDDVSLLEKRQTRQNRRPGVLYSVWNGKQKPKQENKLDAFFGDLMEDDDFDERERKKLKKKKKKKDVPLPLPPPAPAVKEREAEDDTVVLRIAPDLSEYSVKLEYGLTREEVREKDKTVHSFRELSRLAREAEESERLLKKLKKDAALQAPLLPAPPPPVVPAPVMVHVVAPLTLPVSQPPEVIVLDSLDFDDDVIEFDPHQEHY